MVSQSTGESSGTYPEPAKGFASILGTANLNVFHYVPITCFAPSTTFYDTLAMKTVLPLVPLVFLWLPSLVHRLRRRDAVKSDRRAVGHSVLLLIILLPSICSTIFSTFVCDTFEDGRYLRAEYTLACDGQRTRRLWTLFAGLMSLAYPIGEVSVCVSCSHADFLMTDMSRLSQVFRC